ncbi:MAG: ATP-dependent helicase HrpB [Elusimicrobia bacterium]|nr:ATP-dependent helicase HrpB [Elusimicrobiota bacterium]
MTGLPILQNADRIAASAKAGRRLVISAPPGSGKSTQVPQILLDRGIVKGKIAVLQPRRLAARMLAARVAQERGCALGSEVGYRVRFDDKTSKATRLIFETEGILLRELLTDPLLSSYSAVILDEFHERHLHGDMALAVCRALQAGKRPDLLLIAMSATLDERDLSAKLAPCEAIAAQGRLYPVEQLYCDGATAKLPHWDAAARVCAALLPKRAEGHALVFMPGVFEIVKTVSALSKMPQLAEFSILPLHGELSAREQDAALARSSRRKIIVATNIAETSITIDGVTAVVDSGLARIARYDGARAINTLFVEKIPASSAAQRAGRAGRTGPGVCVRLWPERENSHRPLALEPEIQRLDLSETLLALKACGLGGFDSLPWLEPPKAESAARAEALLRELGALDSGGGLTREGRAMAAYPLHPRYARMMLEAEKLGCMRECALVAAIAQGRGLRQENPGQDDCRSDLAAMCALLELYELDPGSAPSAGKRAAEEALKTARRLAPRAKPSGLMSEVAQCFLRAFPDRVAALVPGTSSRYQLSGGKRAALAASSAANGAPIICAGEALESARRGGADITLSLAAEIKEEWLKAAFPEAMSRASAQVLQKDMLTPVTETVFYYRDVPLRREISSADSGKTASDVIAEEFVSGRQRFAQWDEEVEEWLARVEFLHKACPDFGLDPLSEEDRRLLISDICDGAASVSAARNRPVLPALQAWYGWDKTRLVEQHAPSRLQLPAGRKARIRYPQGREPYLEAKIQDLFGMDRTPAIAAGRVPLVVHILAPSMRPVQVTKDLRSFWTESYPKLRPQLARRYPRHKWL